ncbi:unnamed protein product [Symbiodinium sp. CCMP2592]|nr:unnamed protein product [Symbiodinium sp. CCMP2592]
MPARGEVSRRKSLQRVRQNENSIEEFNALVTCLKERHVAKEWLFEMLADVFAQDIMCFSSAYNRDIVYEYKDAITHCSLRALYSDGMISSTFVPAVEIALAGNPVAVAEH